MIRAANRADACPPRIAFAGSCESPILMGRDVSPSPVAFQTHRRRRDRDSVALRTAGPCGEGLTAGGTKLGGGVLVGAAGKRWQSDHGWKETVAPAAAT